MHPEVRLDHPGNCPQCGMALEPVQPQAPVASKVEYTCPMHPQVVRDQPGNCPICGMALEPRTATAEAEGEDPELRSMTRRFWASLALTVPLVLLAMGRMIPGNPMESWAHPWIWHWVELALATPVVLWGGWPFFVRGWRSVATWNLNMFTLIALGTGVGTTRSLLSRALSIRIWSSRN
jgi:Cu+-exporting ATPase